MNFRDIFWLGYKDLKEKKVRTALTIVMVVIGVASIVALISLTQGISASISSALGSLGPTSILISAPAGFSAVDVDRLSTLPNVSSVVPIVIGSVNVYANGQNTSATLIGVTPQDLQLLTNNASLLQGTLYQDTPTPASVLGHSISFPSTLGGSQQNVQVGQPVTIKLSGRNHASYTLPVSGVLQPVGTSLLPIDTSVMVSISEAQLLLNRPSYSLIIVEAKNISSVAPLAALLGDIYGNSATITTTQQILQTVSSIIGTISLFLGVVAGISLIVAAIGIMNVMLIAVYERTHEIGIMKSLGFRSNHILSIFMMQALIIGALGGIFGIALGAGASYGLAALSHGGSASPSSTPTQTSRGGGGVFIGGGGGGGSSSSSGSGFSSLSYSPVFSIATIIEALAVAIIVSLIAGVYPAWRASKMQPIDALREL